MTDKPTHADIWRQLGELTKTVDDISHRIGRESDDGGGGSGLTGRIMRAEAGVGAYRRDRNMILGGLATLAATSLLLILGFKSWVQSWFPGA